MVADLELARRLQPLADGLTRYFRAEVDGLHHIPKGAALLVANHNAGTASPDSFIFASAWLRHNGYTELPVTLGHDLLFRFPIVRSLVRRAGVVPARPGHAHSAFADGHKVLVYPGGQHESVRPSRDRDRVDFGGHTGFIRLALRESVPIVPVVTAGAHDGRYVVSRGDRQRALQRVRVELPPHVTERGTSRSGQPVNPSESGPTTVPRWTPYARGSSSPRSKRPALRPGFVRPGRDAWCRSEKRTPG